MQEMNNTALNEANVVMKMSIKSFVVWAVLTVVFAWYSLTGLHKTKPFNRGMADMWYYYTASAFLFGAAFAWLGYSSARTAEKKQLTGVLFLVDVTATVSYLVQAARITPTIRGVNGIPIDPSRYLEWLCTCPVLIYLIGEVTKNREISLRAMKGDYTLLIFGFLAAIFREPYSEACGVMSCIFFMYVVKDLYDMFQNAIDGVSDCNLDKSALRAVQFATVFSWNTCIIPISTNISLPYLVPPKGWNRPIRSW
jgi:hypothetical protein